MRSNIIAVGCLALTMLTLLSGCSVDAPSPVRSFPVARQPQVRLAAAANLKFAFEKIQKAFSTRHPEIELIVTYGSSGNFYAQLTHEAPFDVFLSADAEYPRKLVEAKRAAPEDEFLYALGRVVVWTRNDSPLATDTADFPDLGDSALNKIAISNPRLAPYGRAAEETLRHYGVYDALESRLVLGENVAQTAQFVESGAADAGIIACSLALADELKSKGRFWLIPDEAHAPLEQHGVILGSAQDRPAAVKLRDFLLGSEAQALFETLGYSAVNASIMK